MTLLGLLIATAAAFAVTERLKLVKSPITGPRISKVFSPTCGCARGKANISLRLRHSDRVTLTVLDGRRDVVATLAAGLQVPRGRSVFHWDGMTDARARAPDGTYRVQIHLEGQHRTILLPNPIAVDSKPPDIRLVRKNLTVVSPDGDTRHDYLKVFFRTTEPARAVLVANGHRVVKVKSFKADSLQWGRRNGMPTKPGGYRLYLRAIDQAGNAGPRSRGFTVRIRFIELGRHVVHARAGGRIVVPVSTDARFYTWRIGPRHGRVRSRRLVLAAGAPGRYHFVVSERGHTARALVVVSP